MNPLLKLSHTQSATNLKNQLALTSTNNIPCDLRIVNIRTMQKNAQEEPKPNQVGLILHKLVFDDCSTSSPSSNAPFVELPKRLQEVCLKAAQLNRQDASSEALQFRDIFKFLSDEFKLKYSLEISRTHLSMGARSGDAKQFVVSEDEKVVSYLDPMSIEAFRISIA